MKSKIDREACRSSVQPIINNFIEVLTNMQSQGELPVADKITLVAATKEGNVQQTIVFGKNKKGVCGFWKPKDYAGPC
jgi:hypothetical protein